MGCIALFLFVGCKSRKVMLNKTDSTETSKVATQTHTDQNSVDLSQSNQVTVSSSTDSSETTTVITPAEGETISVQPDGSFTGKAKSITTTTKNAKKKDVKKQKQVATNIATKISKDSSGTATKEVAVHKKVKETESKANNGWIIYLCLGILLILGGMFAYVKFSK